MMTFDESRRSRASGQRGFALVTSLVLLLVLTLVGVFSMQGANMEYRMAANATFRDRAFQSSETGRRAMNGLVDKHVFERGWPNSITIPSGLSVLDKDTDGAPDTLFLGNAGSEDLLNDTTLIDDARLRIDGNADGDHLDAGDVDAAIQVFRTQVVTPPGAGMQMVSGYEGLGKAAAAGGTHLYFELRSDGLAAGSARATTAADYRTVVRN